MSYKIPDVVVHYSRGTPFRSITSLRPDEVDAVLKTLNPSNAWGLSRFSDPQYLAQRRQAEQDLRKRFVEIGGKPVLQNPIYFFLGPNPRFEEHPQNFGYVISLSDIDPRTISFSYGDSMFCFIDENRKLAGDKYQNHLCERLYSLESLPQLMADPDFPKVDPLHIEAHLWVNPSERRHRIPPGAG